MPLTLLDITFWVPMATLPCHQDALYAVAGAAATTGLPFDRLPADPARFCVNTLTDPDHRVCLLDTLARFAEATNAKNSSASRRSARGEPGSDMRKENTVSLLNNYDANLAALRDAVAEARTIANEHSDEYDWKGLSATRQVFGAEEFAWHVSFSLADFMTHISDSDVRDRSDDELADEIWSCWDTDWDDMQVEVPVGDFRVGSSEFKQRDSEYWGA